MAHESVLDRWRERWWRRGELLAVAGFSTAVGMAATSRWLPFAVSLGALGLGLYIIGAAESRLWLPGRKRVASRATNDTLDAVFSDLGGAGADARVVVRELGRLNGTLRDFYELLAGAGEAQLAESATGER